MEDLEDKLESYKSEFRVFHLSTDSLSFTCCFSLGQFMEFDENNSGDIGKL